MCDRKPYIPIPVKGYNGSVLSVSRSVPEMGISVIGGEGVSGHDGE